MKNKLKIVIPLALIVGLMLTTATNNQVNAALTANDPYITSINLITKGYHGNVNLALNTVNTSIVPIIGLEANVFTAAEQSPALFVTDGITTEYSSDLYTTITTSLASARGIYDTLRSIDESKFSQDAIKQDATIYTFSPLQSFDKTINDTMQAINTDYTDANFTATEAYTIVTWDKALVDELFLAAQERGTFIDTAENFATNEQWVINLLDEIFASRVLDIIYSPYNSTDMLAADSTWTIAEEVQGVMGGNATDVSVNGTNRIVRLRNAAFGFLGKQLVPDTVVGQALKAFDTSVFFDFEVTATSYSFKHNILTDFAGSAFGLGLGALYTMLLPAEVAEVVGLLKIFWLETLLFAFLGLAVVGGITRYFTRKQKNTNSLSLIMGLITFVIVLVIYVFATLGGVVVG